MNAGTPMLVLVLALLVDVPALAQPRVAPCEEGLRRIELTAEPVGEVPQLCIGAGFSTIISFEGAELSPEGVSLEGRERFTRMEVSNTLLRLVPSERVAPGERFKLTVRFRDGQAPASAVFWLGVYPGHLEPLVEVYRQKRSVESCQQEVREKQAQLRQCREAHARLLTEDAGPRGLAGLIATQFMDDRGVVARRLTRSIKRDAANVLEVAEVWSYRSARTVAVKLQLGMTEAAGTWKAVDAELIEPGRRMLRKPRLWQEPPVEPGATHVHLVVETEATEQESRGSFTLKVRGEDGARTLVITGVTFP